MLYETRMHLKLKANKFYFKNQIYFTTMCYNYIYTRPKYLQWGKNMIYGGYKNINDIQQNNEILLN